MPDDIGRSIPTRTFWVIGIVALLWNMIGVGTYLMSVMVSPETLGAMPDAERALYTDIPVWATSAYAIAVWGGALACALLLMRKALAVPLFIVSLIALLVQMGHGLFLTDLLEVRGATAAIMPLLIVGVGAYLVWFSRDARLKGVIS